MALYALDTEFIEDGSRISLVSLALVGDDGHTYYAQVVECDYLRANEFVLQHVIPLLTECPGGQTKRMHWATWSQKGREATCVEGCPWRWRSQIADEVRAFVGAQPQFLTYYGAYDWVALCQLYGPMISLPQGWPMYATDLRAWLDQCGRTDIVQPDAMPHHALSDAQWIMQTWQEAHGIKAHWHG